jgi:hypothetical protein
MGGKRKEAGQIRLVKGIPGGDCDSCSAWLLENIDKTKGARAKLGGIARDHFTILLDDCLRRLLELALPEREKDTITKEWAGRVLARLHASLEVHQRKLGRENPAYRELKAKMRTRVDVLVPKSEISKMVQEELRSAESYQFKLGLIRDSLENQPVWLSSVDREGVFKRTRDQLVLQYFAGVSRTKLKGEALERRYGALWTEQGRAAIEKRARAARLSLPFSDEVTVGAPCTWQDLARREGIPKEYWGTTDLPRFCKESADEWWNWFWSHILQEKNVLIPGRDPSKVQKQIRKYFLALIAARENGTF